MIPKFHESRLIETNIEKQKNKTVFILKYDLVRG